MRVIQEKKTELVLYGNEGVLVVPNTSYFSLKYSEFEGNKISVVLSKNPDIKIHEIKDKEFVCSYNKMKIKIIEDSKIIELCSIIKESNGAIANYVQFFCKNFAEKNQSEIFDVFLKPYENRIKKNGMPHYIIDDVFGVDKWGQTWVRNPNNDQNFPWDKISLEVSGNIEKYKIISSFDGQDLIMDEDLQKLVSKTFFLLSKEKKIMQCLWYKFQKKYKDGLRKRIIQL